MKGLLLVLGALLIGHNACVGGLDGEKTVFGLAVVFFGCCGVLNFSSFVWSKLLRIVRADCLGCLGQGEGKLPDCVACGQRPARLGGRRVRAGLLRAKQCEAMRRYV